MRADYRNLSVLMMMIIKQSFSGTQMMWKISQAPQEALDQVSPGMGGQLAALYGLLARCGGDEFGPLDRRRRPPPALLQCVLLLVHSDLFILVTHFRQILQLKRNILQKFLLLGRKTCWPNFGEKLVF
jgi:hypothetical protein